MKLIIYNNNFLYFFLSYFFLYLGSFKPTFAQESKFFNNQISLISNNQDLEFLPYFKKESMTIYGRLKALSEGNLGVLKETLKIDLTKFSSLNNLHNNNYLKSNSTMITKNKELKASPKPFLRISDKKTEVKSLIKQITDEEVLKTTHTQLPGVDTSNFYENPCIQSGYFDYIEKYKGTGVYNICKNLIADLMFKGETSTTKDKGIVDSTELAYDKKTRNILLLGKEFDSFREVLTTSNITFENFSKFTETFCETPYEEIFKKYTKIPKIETTCFNMTYTINVLKKIYKDEPMNLIFKQIVQNDNNLVSILNRYTSEKMNKAYFAFMVCNLVSVICIYIFKRCLIKFINKFQETEPINRERFTTAKINDKSNIDELILDDVIASIRLRNYIFKDEYEGDPKTGSPPIAGYFKRQLQELAKNERFLSFMEYKCFIYDLIKKNKNKEKIEELINEATIIRNDKNEALAHVYLTVIQLINLMIVGFIIHSILSLEIYYPAETFNSVKSVFILYTVVLSVWFFIEFVILAQELELYSILGFEIISFHDKKFISEQGEFLED